jgi:hypothetical protein
MVVPLAPLVVVVSHTTHEPSAGKDGENHAAIGARRLRRQRNCGERQHCRGRKNQT